MIGAAGDLPAWPGESADAAEQRRWIARVWTIRPLAQAVALASPSLAGRIEQLLVGGGDSGIRLRRTTMSLARYLLRAQGRATPFGAFAGVGTLRFGEGARFRWSGDHRLRARPDAVWLAEVIARLEACLPLLERLPVVANDCAIERGSRLVVACQPHLSTVCGGGDAVEEVSVRLTPVVRAITVAARTPVAAAALVDGVVARFPGVARDALREVVGGLVACGVLISSLRAPGTCTDPLAHVLGQLDTAGADAVPEAAALCRDLHALYRELNGTGRSGELGRLRVAERMRAMAPGADQPLAVDLRLGAALMLPQAVADEAAAAAGALMRLSPQPTASPSWCAYHRDFLARYGSGVLVPLAVLTDPTRGLGHPLHFTDPQAGVGVTRRDKALLALAQQAALEGHEEIALDDAVLDRIAPLTETPHRPVTAVDALADLCAVDLGAIDRGEFTLTVRGLGRRGATTGRFLDLLENGGRRHAALHSDQPTSVHGAIAAQLSFPPRHVRTENVLRVPAVLPWVIPVGEHRADTRGTLPLADLAVAADAQRLYVISRSRGRVVEPMLPLAAARHTMLPLARLLFEIPRAAHPAVAVFDWGIAGCLPRLPRVRHGRSILAPAQWLVDPADLPGPDAPTDQWEEAVRRLRATRAVPARVALGNGDRLLRLDLDNPMDVAVLRRHATPTAAPLRISEAPATAELGWCEGRAHEIVIPLAAIAPPRPAPAFLSSTRPPPVANPHDGDGVVSARLYGPPQTVDEILTHRLPDLLNQWPTPPLWWFVRYRTPVPHLRLRLHEPDHRHACGQVAAWARELRHAGLADEVTLDTYQPETGRYGTGPAMAAAERLFSADSTAVLAQLSFLAANRNIPPQALTAVSLAALAAAVAGGRPAGMHWLLRHPEHTAGASAQDRAMRRHALILDQDRTAFRSLAGGRELAAAWADRADTAARYAAQLTARGGRPSPDSVLGSLLHLHHARACGIDPVGEGTTYKLARGIALASTANPVDRPNREGDR
ncbi:lantibiotic dehydratase [Kitasatospora sp. NPDC092286]|uniref:lantibiotic dehydratase n=1 Tax=Kitasatospora sp. NPDC092286 TaxID=3364087 RepID=UPI0038285D2B